MGVIWVFRTGYYWSRAVLTLTTYLDDMGYLCEIREFGWLASGCFVYACVFSDSYI